MTGVRQWHSASAASGREYEALLHDVKLSSGSLESKVDQLAAQLLNFAAPPPPPSVRYLIPPDAEIESPPPPSVMFDLIPLGGEGESLGSPPSVGARSSDAKEEIPELCALSERFLLSADRLLALLAGEEDLDFSGPIICYCKAFEVESVERLIEPLKRLLAPVGPDQEDINDNDLSRVAR